MVKHLDAYIDFIDMQIAFYDCVEQRLDELHLGGNTVVDEYFLQYQLDWGIKNSKHLIDGQKNELKNIFKNISDIIELEPFSKRKAYHHLDAANQMIHDTINAVYQLDHELKTEYEKSEHIQQYIETYFSLLMAATRQGGHVNPIYYDSAKFRNTEIYKNYDKINSEVKAYLKMKKEEQEKYRIRKLKEKLEQPSKISTDEYIKIVQEVGYDNLTYDQQIYYTQLLQLKSSEQSWEITKGIGVGLYEVGKDFVTGIYDFVTNPQETVKALATSVIHPVDTYKAVKKAIEDSYERDVIKGDAYSRSRWFSYAIGTVVTSVIGTKDLGSVTKTGMATTKAVVKTRVKKATSAAKKVSMYDLLPYARYNQFAFENVPYNVVNGQYFKDSLIQQAKRLSEPFSGKNMKIPWLNKEKYEAYEIEGSVKVNGEMKIVNRRVYTLKDIDINQIDPVTGKTNLQLMKKGDAPYAKDRTKINLHHLIQEEPGTMVELPKSLHQKYHKVLHGLKENGNSFRNNPDLEKQYNNFRKKYWKWRAKQFEKELVGDIK